MSINQGGMISHYVEYLMRISSNSNYLRVNSRNLRVNSLEPLIRQVDESRNQFKLFRNSTTTTKSLSSMTEGVTSHSLAKVGENRYISEVYDR